MFPKPPTLPNFEDHEWNDLRTKLQDEILELAERLVDHMGGPGGLNGTFAVDTADGRHITLTIHSTARPVPN